VSERATLFIDFIRPQWHSLHVTARQYMRPDDANDLVQEALLRAWRGFSPSDDKTYCKAWLFVILRNVAREWHRTATRRVRLVPMESCDLTDLMADDPAEPLAPLPSMSDDRFIEYLDDSIVAALDSLHPAHREVIILAAAGGLDYAEIARVLDCPLGTVMSRMSRARRTLREALSKGTGYRPPLRNEPHPSPTREDAP